MHTADMARCHARGPIKRPVSARADARRKTTARHLPPARTCMIAPLCSAVAKLLLISFFFRDENRLSSRGSTPIPCSPRRQHTACVLALCAYDAHAAMRHGASPSGRSHGWTRAERISRPEAHDRTGPRQPGESPAAASCRAQPCRPRQRPATVCGRRVPGSRVDTDTHTQAARTGLADSGVLTGSAWIPVQSLDTALLQSAGGRMRGGGGGGGGRGGAANAGARRGRGQRALLGRRARRR